MTQEELLVILNDCVEQSKKDPEVAHMKADDALIAYLADEETEAVYRKITRWFA